MYMIAPAIELRKTSTRCGAQQLQDNALQVLALDRVLPVWGDVQLLSQQEREETADRPSAQPS